MMANEKRLIDANEVYELHSNYPMFARSCADLTDLRDILDEAKTVDAIPVVRCKDCKWYQIRKWDDEKPQYDCRKTHALLDVKQDHFCSYGERKEELHTF